ncbi:nuclear transport factor 2 family protein [Nonomuraea phyllanthi]|uniref:nuclear transport factor 2 family protein n=1 Tax=Nonomuraea phyllanthi TaxID=2219224 RepID=UPI00186AE135|nr:nuclear transport factor 2 family protein [Nonomuraea phyllanthi]
MLYDAVGPFVRRGEDPAGRLERWIASYRTGIGHEIRDLEITAGTDLAFRHFLVRISRTMRDGTEVGMWVRATSCLRRQGGAWTIATLAGSVDWVGSEHVAGLRPCGQAPFPALALSGSGRSGIWPSAQALERGAEGLPGHRGRGGEADALNGLATVALALGEFDQAEQLYGAALEAAVEMGNCAEQSRAAPDRIRRATA